jgi:phosphoenolpyruvate carboxylase
LIANLSATTSDAAYRKLVVLLRLGTRDVYTADKVLKCMNAEEHRAQNPDEQVLRGIQLTIKRISAGLRNTG